jgi:hypothetical protein
MKIRGRYYWNLSDFRTVAPGRFEVSRNGNVYQIEGGKSLGGSRADWFVDGPAFNQSIRCTSVRDALRLLDGM